MCFYVFFFLSKTQLWAWKSCISLIGSKLPCLRVIWIFWGFTWVTSSAAPEALSLSGASSWIVKVLEGNSSAVLMHPSLTRFSFRSQRDMLDPFPKSWNKSLVSELTYFANRHCWWSITIAFITGLNSVRVANRPNYVYKNIIIWVNFMQGHSCNTI